MSVIHNNSPFDRVTPLCLLLSLPIVPSAPGQCFHGDMDGSGTVDLLDYAFFEDCMTGPNGGPTAAGCGPVELDADGDIDLHDFGNFQRVFGLTHGPLVFDDRGFGAGDRPWSVSLGDLDRDGALDLAVANYGSSSVSVLLDSGSGSETRPSSMIPRSASVCSVRSTW